MSAPEPRAYLTMPDARGMVQVISRGDAVAQGDDATMRAFLARHYPSESNPIMRFNPDKGFVPA